MNDMWSYDKGKRFAKTGRRWHFVSRSFLGGIEESGELPYELYFRDDEKTEFGLLRFEKSKDNPYRNYEVLISKIMNNAHFRKTLVNSETENVWKKNWK